MKVFRAICNILTTIIVIILLGMAASFFLPGILGGKSLVVLSGSMEPEIHVGSIVFSMPVEASELNEGDIITYALSEDTLVTHRVVTVNTAERTLITKGDANDVEDTAPVPFENVVGRVKLWVPLLGYISLYIKTPLGIAGICGVVFVLILLLYLPEMFTSEDPVKDEMMEEKRAKEKRLKKKEQK